MNFSRRSLGFGLIATCAMLSGTFAHAQDALERIVSANTIRIAIPTDFAPYGFVGPDLQPQGLDIDMARYIGEELGVAVQLIPVTSANRIAYLQTGQADLVISTLGKNPEREQVIDFTAAYSPFFIAAFALGDETAESAEDLAGKSVSVTRGSVDDMELTAVAPAGTEIRRFEDNASTIQAFVAGQTEIVVTSSQVAATMMDNNPNLGVELKFVLKNSPNYIGLGKGQDALRARINEIIAGAAEAGVLDEMSVRWLGEPAGDLPS